MQTAPTNWTALFSAKHKTEYRFLVNGVEYLADDIKGTPTITKKLSDTFTIGQFSCASLTLEIYPKSNIPKAAPVVAYCRLTSTNGSTVTPWMEQGHFWIQSRSSRDGIMSLVCRDASMKAGDSYTDKTSFVDWPQPMTAVVSEIASLMGVEIDSRTVIKTGTDFVVDYPNEDLLMSEILGMIAAAHGGNWIMTEKGKLRLVPMLVTDQPSVFTLGKAYQRFTPLAIPSVITRVTLSDDAGNQFTIGDDSGEEITAECDYATPGVLASIVQDDSIAVENGVLKLNAGSISKGLLNIAAANASIVNGSLTMISRVSYQPYALDGAFVNPLLELGDFFTLNYKGQTYNVLYASANIRLNVSYAADFSLQNKDTTNDEYPYKTARDLKASRYVSTTKTYHGNRINRAEGFVSEYMADGSPIARLIANSNVFSMQQKVNGAWEDRIYFDPVAQRYKIVGDVTVEGSITAEVLATPGGVNITGANITTGTISADRLDFTPINDTIATIQRDLDGLTTKVEDVSSEAIASVVVQYALSDSSSSAPASGWSPIAPAWEAGKYMWQRTVTTFTDSTPEEPHVVTSSPTCIQGASGHDGQPGTNGLNVATVFLYQRATSIPEKPTGNIVYTFASGNVSGALGNWQRNIPVTDGKPCYVIQTTASDAGTTDTIDKDRWSSPVILVEDGADGTNGTDGIGIQSVSISYAVTASPPSSVDPTSLSWQSTIPTVPNGSYLWIRTITDYTDSSVSDTVTYTYSRQGVDGENGQAGSSVTVSSIQYQAGASAINPPTGTWSNDPVSPGQGQYLWTKTTFSNGSVAYSIAYQGVNGQDGTDGISINSVTITYGVSESASVQPSSWQSSLPVVADGQYLWTKTITDYTDSSIPDTVTYTYAKQGEDGDNGQAGTSVTVSSIQYQAGTSPTIAPSGTWQNSPVNVEPGQYLWTKTTFSDNTVAYGVARQGIDGTNGTNGVGISSVSISYAVTATPPSSVDPTSLSWQSTIPSVPNGSYLWIRTVTDYTDSSVTDTITYTYSRQGENGAAGTSVSVTSIQYQAGTSPTTAPTGTWQNNPVTVEPGQYLWMKTTFSDNTVAYGVARQGVNGQNGQNGQDGQDGIGISSVTVTYGVSESASVQPSSWQSSLPVVADGQYLWTKTITDYTDSSIPDTVTYTYAKQGEDGDNGQAGSSVTVSSIQYQAGTSPTTAPTGTWQNNPVTVEQGQYLWTKTTFSDNTVAYGVARQGVNGQDGAAGYSTAIVYLYKRSATAVTVDWTNDLTYNFADKEIEDTLPSGWYETIPSGANPLYVTMATAYSNTGTDAIAYTEWTPPVILAEDGSAGKGVSSIVPEYYLSTSASSPTGGSWTTTPPAWSSGKYIWTRSHIYYDDSTDATTTPVLDNTVTDFGQKYSEVKQTADKINWLVASGTTSANFTMTSRAISQVAETLSLTATASEGTEVGTLSGETYPSGVYRFSKTSDGYYTSGNGGVNSSVAYGKLTFSFTEDTAVVLKCINRGETIYDFGIVSELDTTLSKDTSEDTTGVLKSFKGLVSEDPVDLTLIIPSGSHFITFKYKKDSSAHSEGDYFKIKATTQPKPESTLTLKSGQTSLSSAKIVFSGLVTFTDLSSAGSTVINGANIKTGQIAADRIDVANLHVTSVYYNDSDDYKILEASVAPGFVSGVAIGVQNSSFSTSGIVYYGDIHIFSKYGDASAGQFVINRTSASILGNDWKIGSEQTPFFSIHLKDAVHFYDSYQQTWHELYAYNGSLWYDSTRLT